MHQEYLSTTAEVSGALLGFVGVILVIGRRSEGVITSKDKSGLFHLVYTAAGALFFSLTMYLFLISFQMEAILWRAGLAIMILHSIFGVSKAIREGRGGDNRLNPLARFVLSAITFVSISLNATIVAGYLPTLAPFAYCATVTFLIGIAVSYFIPFILGDDHNDAEAA